MLVENVLSYQISLGLLKSVIMADICKVKESFKEDCQIYYIYWFSGIVVTLLE